MGPQKFTPFFTEYADQSSDDTDNDAATESTEASADGDEGGDLEIVIPEDLSTLDDTELANVHSGTVEAFNSLYGEDGSGLTDEALDVLSVLTQGIERINTELTSRQEAAAKRADAATALAARVGIEPGQREEAAADVEPEVEAETSTETLATEPEPQPEPVKEIRVNLSGLRSRQAHSVIPTEPTPLAEIDGTPTSMRDIVKASPEFHGYAAGQGLDWDDIGRGLDRRLSLVNRSQWELAQQQGRPMRQQQSIAVIQKPIDKRLLITSEDPTHVSDILKYAAQESRLPGGSLVASGGWCAPSETIYTLLELESRDGLFSLPEVGITRGGINFTPGPNFAEIYAAYDGFDYSEDDDEAGHYAVDANGVGTGSAGTKPCYHIGCPSFTEARLRFAGLCLSAGLLQQRGYPEMIARTTRGVLVGHDHRMSGRVLAQMETGSTAVSMAASQVGATAPILTAIELQVEHYRTVHRLTRSTSLEAVFPFWVHGAVRSDLSRRLGVDLFDVSDARIDGWFRDRGIAPQFVYNWNDVSGTAANFKAWPTSVKFLLYVAGTWVRGTSDIVTLDTIYDSVGLGTNDFTALFTEEGYLVAKLGHDSRVVTVNICPDGATHGGVDIDCNGAIVVAP